MSGKSNDAVQLNLALLGDMLTAVQAGVNTMNDAVKDLVPCLTTLTSDDAPIGGSDWGQFKEQFAEVKNTVAKLETKNRKLEQGIKAIADSLGATFDRTAKDVSKACESAEATKRKIDAVKSGK